MRTHRPTGRLLPAARTDGAGLRADVTERSGDMNRGLRGYPGLPGRGERTANHDAPPGCGRRGGDRDAEGVLGTILAHEARTALRHLDRRPASSRHAVPRSIARAALLQVEGAGRAELDLPPLGQE